MLFELMNCNKVVGKLECEMNLVRLLEYDGSLLHIGIGIQEFIDARLNPVLGRKNMQKLLREADIHNTAELIQVSKALSFNDTLWVREHGDTITWDKVNPYTNSISRIVSQIALEGYYKKGMYESSFRTPSPEYETGGTFSKCWKRINGSIYMIKGGEEKYSGVSGNSSYNEYFACQVAKALDIRYYTEYSISERTDDIEGTLNKRAFTMCKLFTSEMFGYLSIGESKYKNAGLGAVFKLMQSLGNEKEFREMLLLDSIIYNIDRHKGNYGFIIDNRNYKIVKMAPIFDNNLSFLSNISLHDTDEVKRHLKIDIPYTLRHTNLNDKSFVRQGKMAINSSDELRNRLYNLQDFKLDRKGIKYLESERMDFMDKLIQNQVKAILN